MTEFLLKSFINDYQNTEDKNVRYKYGKFAGVIGIICNIVLFVSKLIIGTISGSVSITADAVNNLTDFSSSVISLLGFKLSERPADEGHPYGHGRYEYLSGLTVSVLIIVIGIELFRTGLDKILHPSAVDFSPALVVVLILSILLKLWMMYFNNDIGKRINSNALFATATDSRNDVITTLAVLLAAIISYFTPFELDGWIGLGVAVFILVSGFGLIKEMIDPMLGSAPDPHMVLMIRKKIMSYDGVLGMHDLMIHDYGPSRQFVSVHVEMPAEEDVIISHDTIDNIESDFMKEHGITMIIHYDPVLTNDPLTVSLRKEIAEIVSNINSELTIHDLRVVPGTTHTNVVFDTVAPFSLKISDSDLKSEIIKEVRKAHPDYNCVITIDRIT